MPIKKPLLSTAPLLCNQKKEHYFAKLQFGQTTVGYKSIQSANGFNAIIDFSGNHCN
jgi:hypothetical protein